MWRKVDWLDPPNWKIANPKSKKAVTMKVTVGYIRAANDAEDDVPIIRYLPMSLIEDVKSRPESYRIRCSLHPGSVSATVIKRFSYSTSWGPTLSSDRNVVRFEVDFSAKEYTTK